MSISNQDFLFCLTSVEPLVYQPLPSQSIGGSPSCSSLGPVTSLLLNSNHSPTTLFLSNFTATASPGVVTGPKMQGTEYLLVDSEIIQIMPATNVAPTVVMRGAVDTGSFPHLSETPVYGLSVNSLFDNRLNGALKQYRCIAIRNTNQTQIAHNVEFYIKSNSVNPQSTVRIAVEMPSVDAITNIAVSSGTRNSTVISSLTGYADNVFVGSVMTFGTGSSNPNYKRTITSYDAATHTFMLDSSLPTSARSGDLVIIDQCPSQRVISGIVKPSFGSGNVSALSLAEGPNNALGVNVTGSRQHGNIMQPNDTIYIWFERSLTKNSPQFDDNRIILAMRYATA